MGGQQSSERDSSISSSGDFRKTVDSGNRKDRELDKRMARGGNFQAPGCGRPNGEAARKKVDRTKVEGVE